MKADGTVEWTKRNGKIRIKKEDFNSPFLNSFYKVIHRKIEQGQEYWMILISEDVKKVVFKNYQFKEHINLMIKAINPNTEIILDQCTLNAYFLGFEQGDIMIQNLHSTKNANFIVEGAKRCNIVYQTQFCLYQVNYKIDADIIAIKGNMPNPKLTIWYPIGVGNLSLKGKKIILHNSTIVADGNIGIHATDLFFLNSNIVATNMFYQYDTLFTNQSYFKTCNLTTPFLKLTNTIPKKMSIVELTHLYEQKIMEPDKIISLSNKNH